MGTLETCPHLAMQIKDSSALVSGGSSGLGGACVRHLAKAGASVIIADLNQEAGEKLAAELGSQVRFVKTDVTDEYSVKNAVAAAGHLRISIQCAGMAIADR